MGRRESELGEANEKVQQNFVALTVSGGQSVSLEKVNSNIVGFLALERFAYVLCYP